MKTTTSSRSKTLGFKISLPHQCLLQLVRPTVLTVRITSFLYFHHSDSFTTSLRESNLTPILTIALSERLPSSEQSIANGRNLAGSRSAKEASSRRRECTSPLHQPHLIYNSVNKEEVCQPFSIEPKRFDRVWRQVQTLKKHVGLRGRKGERCVMPDLFKRSQLGNTLWHMGTTRMIRSYKFWRT